MKKFILFTIIVLTIFTGCTPNAPEKIDVEATLQSIAEGIITEKNLVNQEDLKLALEEQSRMISADMDLKLELMMTSVAAEISKMVPAVPTPTLSVGSGANPNTTASTTGACTNKFAYVSDVTFPDGTMTLPRTTFTKSWYIQNTGTCDWTSKYSIVYISGNEVGVQKEFPIFPSEKLLKSGESTIVSVKINAPEALNAYTTYWALKSPDGKIFAGGDKNDVYLSSKFVVGNQYNFYENLGGARCSDDQGAFFCGSSDRSSGRGTVSYASAPTVESNYAGQASIVITPPKQDNGTTRVTFGPVQFVRGTWLRAAISCPPNAPLCDNYVRLYVAIEGEKEQLVTETQENNDGFATQWNIQLSEYGYHDQSLLFTFEVQAIGGSDTDDKIIIQVPRLTDSPPVH